MLSGEPNRDGFFQYDISTVNLQLYREFRDPGRTVLSQLRTKGKPALVTGLAYLTPFDFWGSENYELNLSNEFQSHWICK